MRIKSVKEIEVSGKRIILRADFNVPMKNGRILDDNKIKETMPTIKYLLAKDCRIVIISHLGRPNGKRVARLSLKPVFMRLRRHLPGVAMEFATKKLTVSFIEQVKSSNARVVVLENIRFESGEEENSADMARRLSRLGEIFVNEAFAVSHRKAASVCAITKFLPSAAGMRFQEEIKHLSRAINPAKPAVALIGGAKVETKFAVIKNFLRLYNKILLGGALANTFLLANGYVVGNSLVDADYVGKIKKLMLNQRILLPIDVVVSQTGGRGLARVVNVGKNKKLCGRNEEILDIGPQTIKKYALEIRKAKTIVWSGPMGMFENKKFSHGTLALARLIGGRASGRALGIAGGGETQLAIEMSGMARYYDFISTGGGAMLEFLSGKALPCIKPLIS